VPTLIGESAHVWVLGAFGLGLLLAWRIALWARRRQARTGQQFHAFWAGLAIALGLPLAVFLAAGAPFKLEVPALAGFNFAGGATLTPEFAALLAGLSVYTAAFIAEIVRAGVLAVQRGQFEAAYALGLHRNLAMRLVVLPQALRVIVPPLTSQYLGRTKDSWLAVAIGYPDIVSIANTANAGSATASSRSSKQLASNPFFSTAAIAMPQWIGGPASRGRSRPSTRSRQSFRRSKKANARPSSCHRARIF